MIKVNVQGLNPHLTRKALYLLEDMKFPTYIMPSQDYSLNNQYNSMTDTSADIVVLMDEDVFFINPNVINDIADYMITEKVPFMAMRELSGVSKHRTTVPNAVYQDYNSFLCFFQPKLIKYYIPHLSEIFKQYMPKEYIEPYWVLFRCLYDLKIIGQDFNGCTSPSDHISTVLYWKQLPFCLHTWYARNYTNKQVIDGYVHGDRIDQRYLEVSLRGMLNDTEE